MQNPAKSSRVGVVAALALVVGAGAGYFFRTPPAPVELPVSVPVAANRVEQIPAAVPIPPRAADEPVIALRLDRNIESLSRIRPSATSTDGAKKP